MITKRLRIYWRALLRDSSSTPCVSYIVLIKLIFLKKLTRAIPSLFSSYLNISSSLTYLLFIELDETGDGIIAVKRTWKGKKSTRAVASLKSLVDNRLPSDNVINIDVDQKQGGINPDNRSHKGYLAHLCRLVVNRVQNLVNASIEADPEIKSKKKMVQEIYAESLVHLALLREIKPCENNENIERIREILISGNLLLLMLRSLFPSFFYNCIIIDFKKSRMLGKLFFVKEEKNIQRR